MTFPWAAIESVVTWQLNLPIHPTKFELVIIFRYVIASP